MSQGCMAAGNISPATFVILDNAAGLENQVLQATSATSRPLYGVSMNGTHNVPIQFPGGTNPDDGYAAVANQDIGVFTEGDRCQITAGAAFNAGDLLTADSSGRAIATTTDGNFVGAVALEGATAANQLVECRVTTFQHA